MIDLEKIATFSGEHINVIIETPRGSRNKYAYDEDMGIMKLKKTLPEGHTFPYDFGFIPHTLADDGDPIDVLVMMDAPGMAGCLVECRVIGAITAVQSEKGKTECNDRILAIPVECKRLDDIHTIKDVNDVLLEEIEAFFISYNAAAGKEFHPQKKIGAHGALRLIRKAMTKL
jgi:inorganic pyrophosphatase